jgi:hypothetical protein
MANALSPGSFRGNLTTDRDRRKAIRHGVQDKTVDKTIFNLNMSF